MAQPAKMNSNINPSSASPFATVVRILLFVFHRTTENSRRIFGLKQNFDSLPFKLLLRKDVGRQEMTRTLLPNTMTFLLQKT